MQQSEPQFYYSQNKNPFLKAVEFALHNGMAQQKVIFSYLYAQIKQTVLNSTFLGKVYVTQTNSVKGNCLNAAHPKNNAITSTSNI